MTIAKTLDVEARRILAGIMKALVMADGNIDSEELDYLDELLLRYGFTDYEARLSEAEERFRDLEDLVQAARKIHDPETRDAISGIAYELSLRYGAWDCSEGRRPGGIYRRLLAEWSEAEGSDEVVGGE